MTLRFTDASIEPDALHERAAERAARFAGAPAVAFDAHPTLDTVVTLLACLEAGVAAVPVPPDSGPAERSHLLGDSGASTWDGQGLAGGGERIDAALVLYTSGTTGPPKGALISRPAIDACLDGLAEAWAWTADDVLVHGLPLYPRPRAGARRARRRCASAAAWSTPDGRCPNGTRRPTGRSTSAYRPSGPASAPTRRRPGPCPARGCWSRAAPRCRSRCSTRCASSPGTSRSSATA